MSFGYQVSASGGDDTAALQAAINSVRTDNGGRILLENKEYHVSSLDCTALSGLEIYGMPNTRISPDYMTTAGKVFNFAGSSNWAIRNLEIFASGERPAGIAWPTHAVYAQDLDKIVLDRVRTPGKWTMAGVSIVGVHSISLRDCQLSNFDESAAALAISSLTGRNSSDFYSSNCEYHAASGVPYTIKLNNCDHLVFIGGICDNSANAHILSQGAVAHVSLETVKFYSELTHPSGAVLLCNSGDTISFLRVCNPTRDSIPLITAGGGIDSTTLRIETP